MPTLNLGILAHVDAGKTTLTERLLLDAGAIDRLGSVDAGTTQTDSLAMERRRGITIRAAVVGFRVADLDVNLIDTPGHPDFIAEVERSLSVLDGAVLVLSAVEGVQAQSVVLMRALRRLRIPTLLFVNKIDRTGADPDAVMRSAAERFDIRVLPMSRAVRTGSADADAVSLAGDDPGFVERAVDALAAQDTEVLAAYLDDDPAVADSLPGRIAAQTARCAVYPAYVGSAALGVGVAALTRALRDYLPSADEDADADLAATVFSVQPAGTGGRRAYVRVSRGRVRIRDRVQVPDGEYAVVTGIEIVQHGGLVAGRVVSAGQIAALGGLDAVRVGDRIGVDAGAHESVFAPPTVTTAVVAEDPALQGHLHASLVDMSTQDPLIGVRQDDAHDQLSVSLYGDVQKEVIAETLREQYGVAVQFRDSTVLCIERPAGTGSAITLLGAPDNPWIATLGLTVEAAPAGHGLQLRVTAPLATIPLYVYKTLDAFAEAMEHNVSAALEHGPSGWPVRDCVVTVTDCDYSSPSTGARDLRRLTPIVLSEALRRAGTVVCEPIQHVRLDVPADCLAEVLRLVTRHGGVPGAPTLRGRWAVIEGELPAARVRAVQVALPGSTHGEGAIDVSFARYAPIARSGDRG